MAKLKYYSHHCWTTNYILHQYLKNFIFYVFCEGDSGLNRCNLLSADVAKATASVFIAKPLIAIPNVPTQITFPVLKLIIYNLNQLCFLQHSMQDYYQR